MTLDEIISALRGKKLVDLTHSVTESIPIFSALARFPACRVTRCIRLSRMVFFAQQVTFVTQTGTHIDAPTHFSLGNAVWMVLPTRRCCCRWHDP
ncbi:MAG: cyclase family protein [Symbiopectobacterium sp.]